MQRHLLRCKITFFVIFSACFLRRWIEWEEEKTCGRSISPASCFSHQTTQLQCVCAVLRSSKFNGRQSTHTHAHISSVCVCVTEWEVFYPRCYTHTCTALLLCCCFFYMYLMSCTADGCQQKSLFIYHTHIVATSAPCPSCRGSSRRRTAKSQPHIFSLGLIHFLTLQNCGPGWAAICLCILEKWLFPKGWASFCTAE